MSPPPPPPPLPAPDAASPARPGPRPRRVLYVTDIYGGHHGGSEGQLVALVRGLPAAYEPRLLVVQQSRWLSPEGFPAPVCTYRLGRLWNPLTWLRLLALSGKLRAERIDLVHTYHSDASWQLPLLAAWAGVPVVISRRDLGFWQTPRVRGLLRRTGRFVDLVVANAQAVKEQAVEAEHLPPGRVTVVGNGHDPARFQAPADPGLRDRLGVPAQARVLGLLANLKPLKRQEDLVDALAGELGRRFPDVHVLLIGTGAGGEEQALLARAARGGVGGRVHVLGVTGDVVPVLKHLCVGVLCSETEGLSNAILEYMGAGLPVVATEVGGNPELVEDGVNGFLYPVGRVDLLAERLGRLLADEALRRRLGDGSRARFEGRYRLDAMVAATTAAYASLLEPRPPAPDWRWEVLNDPVELARLEGPWRALLGPRRFFVGPTWVLGWLDAAPPGTRLVAFVARDGAGALRGLATFVERRGALSFPGQGEGADHLDVVAAPQDALPFARGLLARFAAGPWRRLTLAHVADDAALRLAVRERGWRGLFAERSASVAPWIETTGTFDGYLARGFDKKQRHENRRVVKRFREQPGATVERVTDPDRAEGALDLLLELHARAFRARGAATVFQGERVRALHRAVLRRAARDGSLWLRLLRQGDEPLAAYYGFRWAGVLHHLQSGVDPARRSFGPGKVLRLIALEEDVFGQGIVDYDFMDGDEPYKREWTSRRRLLFDLTVERPGLGGRLRTLGRGLLGLLREAARAVRDRLRARAGSSGPAARDAEPEAAPAAKPVEAPVEAPPPA